MAKEKHDLKMSAVITKSQRATIERISRKIKRLNGADLTGCAIVRATLEAVRIGRIWTKVCKTAGALASSHFIGK